MPKTAGIIIIADEVLSGNIVDTNSPFLCKELHALGVRVSKISTIPDQVDQIKCEVKSFSDSFDIVITTGGVGPTHDDVTYEGVAAAFGVPLRRDKQMEDIFAYYLKKTTDPAAEKLITIPSSADVILATGLESSLYDGEDPYPVPRVRNVFCFPGVPSYLRAIFPALAPEYFRDSSTMYFLRTVRLSVDEIRVVSALNDLAAKFAGSVDIGSYPSREDPVVGTIANTITIESASLARCLEAERLLISRINPSWIIHRKVDTTDFAQIERLNSIETELSDALSKSYQIIEQCFDQFTVDETFISFNGGKDCTVLLNLICAFCVRRNMKQRLKLLYFQEADAFEEVEEFINDIAKTYNVDVCTLPMPMKDSLRVFLAREPSRKACFMGLRSTDPKSENLEAIQVTDSDWPKVVRISPILHWTYKNIWDFLRCTNVPYCSLYDKGYSSVGNRNNTSPNPALQFTSDDGTVHYRPAFFLDDRFERQGRHSAANDRVASTHL